MSVAPILAPASGSRASLRRIRALIHRYVYLLRSSWVRVIELVYWPFLQMLMWGFLQKYLTETAGPAARGAGLLIGGVLLWDIFFRAKIGFSTAFIEEVWSRNLGNLLISPLRPNELLLALSTISILRLIVSMVPVTFAAWLFFGFNLFGLGLALGAFFAVLILTSWALGLISSGFILRYGLGAGNSPGRSRFCFCRWLASITPSVSCRVGYNLWRWPCPRHTCSRACAPSCSISNSSPNTCSGRLA